MDGVDLVPFAEQSPPAGGRPHDALFWRGGHYQVVIADGWKMQRAKRPDKVWLL